MKVTTVHTKMYHLSSAARSTVHGLYMFATIRPWITAIFSNGVCTLTKAFIQTTHGRSPIHTPPTVIHGVVQVCYLVRTAVQMLLQPYRIQVKTAGRKCHTHSLHSTTLVVITTQQFWFMLNQLIIQIVASNRRQR